jgi:STE24 endopeptidase
MHPFTVLFVAFLAAGLALRAWLQWRQIRAVRAGRERVPAPFAASITRKQHARAADYTTALTRAAMAQAAVSAAILLLLTIGGGIGAIDAWIARFGLGPVPHGVAVIAATALGLTVCGLPFDLWSTFGIEARFGFNRTTPALFAVDLLKGLAISAVLLLPLVAAMLWSMPALGDRWWLWAWGGWALFSILISWAWPRLIAPLFNRFHELEDGELRRAVEALARRCGFEPRGVRVMDGSRRSTHGNAYFTGLGRAKRIVFFDTLLQSLAPPEVQAVLAHELGHYRLKHVAWRIAWSLAAAFAGFAALAWLAGQPWFQPALGVTHGGTHTLFLLFALAAPVFLVPVGPLMASLSRRHEFQADDYAARHTNADALADALVKLFRDNATTLTPDRLYTAFHASHPPALERIARLRPQGGE